jgi:hypothetical protein
MVCFWCGNLSISGDVFADVRIDRREYPAEWHM